MQTGETVFMAFSTSRSSDLTPFASVTEATVLDAENGVLRLASGQVLVHEPKWSSSTLHATEAEAWGACAAKLEREVAAINAEISRCATKAAEVAAASRIVAVTA